METDFQLTIDRLMSVREAFLPIFISYSQQDNDFADQLAKQLVYRRHNVWMDRWELNVGDSLMDKIQGALTDSSAILVLLSKSSVQSEWCRKELNAGLVRELDERRVILMPCVIEDCDIPLFLRDKLYADFRKSPDKALEMLDRALAKISTVEQGRIETPNFHTDWAVDWKSIDGTHLLEWIFVDHNNNWPYVIVTQCSVVCDEKMSREFTKRKGGDTGDLLIKALEAVVDHLPDGFTVKIENAREVHYGAEVKSGAGSKYLVEIGCRRLGEDNGMDTLVYVDNTLRQTLVNMKAVAFQPKP